MSDIAASLQYGNIITKKRLISLYFAIGFNALIPIFSIFFMIVSVLNNDLTLVIIMIIVSMVFIFLLSLLVYIPIRDRHIKNTILPFLEDGIELKAYSKVIDAVRSGFQPEYYKIEVSFSIGGKKYKRTSGNKNGSKAYHKIFRAYHDREINILYSPKYDEVLILKD